MTFDYLRTLYVCVCGKNDSGHRCDECMALLAKPSMTHHHPEWFDCATRRSDHQPLPRVAQRHSYKYVLRLCNTIIQYSVVNLSPTW
jgi:hypothetical protein